ncbi:MAG: hypothetical protein ACKVWV_17050 [Planctomycetota bacterium]
MNAQAQIVNCGDPTGPDVIVGDLTGPANYAAVGGIEALSLGTTSCNMGQTWLNWFQNTNQHPVIGGALYRFQRFGNGVTQFEQVGISWLKHGFFALSQNLCGCGCAGTDGTHLGVGCSDPYTAGRNGTQAPSGGLQGLGPRWQVNANTGIFTFPPANPAFAGTVARRLEVAQTDLAVNTVDNRYFGESQYVSPDDAAAGNQNNNSSYREVSYNGTATFGYIGTTVRQQPGINAWKVCDPTVTLVPHELTNEGLYVLGYDVTDLGGGTWHYEYSLYNMNSDLSGQSFTVPVPAGINVTNIGFRDVTYRNGDGPGSVNFSGTDWVGVRNANDVSWATETFASNPSANALRWSTTYSFRFDADAAPAAANVALGLFKNPGAGPALIASQAPASTLAAVAYCFGDGSLSTPCPCVLPFTVPNPSGATDAGCANSFDLNGAKLTASGSANPDSVVLEAEQLTPSGFTFWISGDSTIPNGIPNGDGVQCAGGNFIRFGGQNAVGGTATYPNPGLGLTVPLSTATGVVPGSGSVRYMQAFYRNAVANFCNLSTYNVSNAVELTWN